MHHGSGKTALIVSILIISLFGGCGRRGPVFLVQTSILPYRSQIIVKEAIGKYRYFRDTGWTQTGRNGRIVVTAIAKPEIERILAELKTRAANDPVAREELTRNAERYRQYLATVAYDFIFYVEADHTVTYGGLTIREFTEGESSVKNESVSEQTSIMTMMADQVFPGWIEDNMRKTVSRTTTGPGS